MVLNSIQSGCCDFIIVTFLQTASVLFVDAPVGTGFSYATSADEYPLSDLKAAAQVTGFLRKVNVRTRNQYELLRYQPCL